MSTITTRDGTVIYYEDWGSGQPVVFSHGWPLCADAWESQMVYLASKGYRCLAHDRRGHGRSSQPWDGNNMDTYADDLSELIETLGLNDTTLVGHSAGGGEAARYIGRHGTRRVAKAVLVGAVTPLMLKTAANPGGLAIEAFDKIRAGVAASRLPTTSGASQAWVVHSSSDCLPDSGVVALDTHGALTSRRGHRRLEQRGQTVSLAAGWRPSR
jgi:non-heme chloroperoxidase